MVPVKRWRRGSKLISEINITPLTDVVLVLLIIFIVTTPLIMQSGIKVRLPRAQTQEVTPEKSVTVSMVADGSLFLNDKPLTMADLPAALQKAVAESTSKLVIINADTQVQHGSVVDVLDAARQAGAERLAISTEPKSAPKP